MTAQIINLRGQHVRETLPTGALADSGNMSAGTAANAAAVVSVVADTTRPILVSQIWWSYIGGAVTGNIQLTDGTNAPVNLDIGATGPGNLAFSPPLIFGSNKAVTLTLGAGGVGVTGKVGMNAYRLQ